MLNKRKEKTVTLGAIQSKSALVPACKPQLDNSDKPSALCNNNSLY